MGKRSKSSGFTLVEMISVIIIIGILAGIMIVSYNGAQRRAGLLSLVSDLTSANDQLLAFQSKYNHFPATISCNDPDSSTNVCIEASADNTFIEYTYNNNTKPQTFGISSTNDYDVYRITDTAKKPIPCMTGSIVVPGSDTYDTSDFCVMKYEAKNVSGVATSQYNGTFWASINQDDAHDVSPSACYENCHLITEAEWLTIAQNVLGVSSNWDNGAGVHTVGTGYVYSGHNDNSTASPLDAEDHIGNQDDVNGYIGTGNSSPSNQRRTLTLSNGEIIWDLAGNVDEWTSEVRDGGQPGVAGNEYNTWMEWNTASGSLSPSPYPSSTGVSGSASWVKANGIGGLYSSTVDTDHWSFVRGGSYGNQSNAGIFAAAAGDPDTPSPGADDGFRVAR